MSTTKTVEFVNLAKLGLGLERAVALVTARHYAQGQRVVVLAADSRQAEALDNELWSFRPDSFLPHALAGAADQAQEPVLIATEPANPNRAEVLVMAQALEEPPLEEFGHLVEFVPPAAGPELEASRRRYRRLKERGGVRLLHTTRLEMPAG